MFDGLIGVKDSGESLDLFFDGQDEPFTIAKHGNDAMVAQLMPYVVPDDAPGHAFGAGFGGFALPAVLANAMPPTPMTQEEQDAVIAEQAAYTQASLANEPVPEIGPQELAGPPAPVGMPQPAPPARFEAPFDLGESTPSTRAGTSTANRLPPAAPIEFDPMKRTGDGSVILTPEQAKAAAGEGAPAMDVPPPEPGPQAPGSGSGSVAQKFAMSTKGGGGGVDTRVRPMPAQDTSLLEKQAANALAMGDLKAEAELAKAKILEDDSIKRINVDKEYQDRLAQNQRNIDELDADIRNGKVDPNRLWSSMDGARQATMLVSLALGGLAQGASGFRTDNMALQTMNRMIDRDIEAQKDNLGRKESLLNMHMQQGRDLRSAWQMTKADMLTSLAAQLQAQAARSGSPQELKAAEAAALNLRQQAQQAQAQAEGAWRDDEFKRIEVQSQAALRGAQASALRIETALKVADAGRGPETGKNPPMEIAPGVIVQPADATSRQNLEKAVDAFNTMRNLVVEARAHRAKAGAQLIPRTADYVKANRLEKQLITALNNVENLGAFDKGTADLLGQIVPTVGGVYTPGVVDESLADLLSLAEKKFKTKVMTNVIPGTGLVSFTGAQSDFKPVGKAD